MTTILQIVTLVDITATGITRSTGDRDLERNEQRNWETVVQVLGLRTQPHIVRWPQVLDLDAEDVKALFGDIYSGPQRAWEFEFTADHPEAYNTEEGPLTGLLKDFEQVPVITGLNETARFLLPIFYPFGAIKNIHIMYYPKP